MDLVDFELKEGVKPVCSRHQPVPKLNEATLKKGVERLLQVGVLEQVNDTKRGAP